ncbi:ATP-binding protein [Streptomyces oceani]|uniref:ATP-binding protein n=1 Tax=Streptomyces oceani TaxID=1075402 RepID=UPI000871D72F|nr:ATP-binding protein [Streptomyces oceani]
MAQQDDNQPAGDQPYEQSVAPHAHTVQLISGDYLLTVNPVDGSEIESCPPGRRPARPRKFGIDERPGPRHPEHSLTGVPVPPVPAAAVLLEREEERAALAQSLSHGRSVRLTGAPGTGRSALLDAVAEDVATIAPDGVVRLSGHRRTADDVLRALFAATHDSPYVRPDTTPLLELLSTVGAVVLVDDVEFGGSELDRLLEAAPECAFLVTAAPGVPAPDPMSRFTETQLTGLSRTGCAELLEHAVQRQLTEQETDWAGDLWFESEGRPLLFVQAGALLRQRDAGRDDMTPGTSPEPLPPAVQRGGAPGLVAVLAGGLPRSAQEALCLAVALKGELPHPTSLADLVEDSSAAEEFASLTASGLVSTAGGRMLLAAGVLDDLTVAGYGEGAAIRVTSVAQHYGWWVGQSVVSAPRASAEAEAILAALHGVQETEQPSTVVLLARAAAPVFAGALRWGAWQRAVRAGQEAARATGQVDEEAYFRHELGVHALCTGDLERARGELEASIALRGSFTDRSGTVAGRRALALVTDQVAAAGGEPALVSTPSSPNRRVTPTPAAPGFVARGESLSAAEHRTGQPHPPEWPHALEPPASGAASSGGGSSPAGDEPSYGPTSVAGSGVAGGDHRDTDRDAGGVPPVLPLGAGAPPDDREAETLVSAGPAARGERTGSPRRLAALGTRRNMVAAGAGALLVAVLGTVVTIGSTSSSSEERSPADTVRPEDSTPQGADSTKPSEDVSTPPETPPPPASEPSGPSSEPGPTTSEETSAPENSDSPPSSSPEDPTTSPEDPTTSPEDPDPSSSPADTPSRGSSQPRSDTQPEQRKRGTDGPRTTQPSGPSIR